MKKEFQVRFVGYVHIDGCEKHLFQEILPNAIWREYKHYGDYYIPDDCLQELSLEQIQKLTEIRGVDGVTIINTNTLLIIYDY